MVQDDPDSLVDRIDHCYARDAHVVDHPDMGNVDQGDRHENATMQRDDLLAEILKVELNAGTHNGEQSAELLAGPLQDTNKIKKKNNN